MAESDVMTAQTGRARVVICMPGASFTEGFMRSFIDVYRDLLLDDEIEVAIAQHYSSDVMMCRNGLLTQNYGVNDHDRPDNFGDILPFAGVRYDYLLWIDSDQVYNTEHVRSLLSRNKDIVAAYTPLAPGDPRCAAGWWGHGVEDERGKVATQYLAIGAVKYMTENPDEAPDGKIHQGMIEVDFAGFGMILIKQGVMEAIGYPWFSHEHAWVNGKELLLSEDISFSKRATDAGFKIYVDPDARIGHQKMCILQ